MMNADVYISSLATLAALVILIKVPRYLFFNQEWTKNDKVPWRDISSLKTVFLPFRVFVFEPLSKFTGKLDCFYLKPPLNVNF